MNRSSLKQEDMLSTQDWSQVANNKDFPKLEMKVKRDCTRYTGSMNGYTTKQNRFVKISTRIHETLYFTHTDARIE